MVFVVPVISQQTNGLTQAVFSAEKVASDIELLNSRRPLPSTTSGTSAVPDNRAEIPKIRTSNPTETIVETEPQKTACVAIGILVKNYSGFNGAKGSIKQGEISFSSLYSKDGGMSIEMNRSIKGSLQFKYSGLINGGGKNGGFTVLFIKADPYYDYSKDKVLNEKTLYPEFWKEHTVTMEVPEGTDKISIMLVGRGFAKISISDVILREPIPLDNPSCEHMLCSESSNVTKEGQK